MDVIAFENLDPIRIGLPLKIQYNNKYIAKKKKSKHKSLEFLEDFFHYMCVLKIIIWNCYTVSYSFYNTSEEKNPKKIIKKLINFVEAINNLI